MINPQYKHQIKKGDTVKYGTRCYPVQQDRKYLHIIIFEDGQRKKIGLDKIGQGFFEPGSEADYIFNGWWEHYELDEFLSFAAAEMNWLTPTT